MTESALVLDDEPHLLDWLAEYLQAKGLSVSFAVNVEEAVKALGAAKYRLLVLDLNVPVPATLQDSLAKRGAPFVQYPGLYVAEYARSHGYRDRQVIVYSVHDVEAVREATRRMEVTYCTKGRPRAFKDELDDVLRFDPTQKKARKRIGR